MTEAEKRRLIVKYTESDCGILAVALHEKIGSTLVGTRFTSTPPNCHYSYDHFGIKNSDCFWDIRGPITEKEFVALCGPIASKRCFDIVDTALIVRFYEKISALEKNLAIKNYLRIHGELPAVIIPGA